MNERGSPQGAYFADMVKKILPINRVAYSDILAIPGWSSQRGMLYEKSDPAWMF